MERWSRSVAEVVAIVGRWPEGGQFSTKIARHGPSRVASVTRKILHTSAYVRLVSSISVHEPGRKRSFRSVAAVSGHRWLVDGGVSFRGKNDSSDSHPTTDDLWPPPPPRSGTIAPSRNQGPIPMIQASCKCVQNISSNARDHHVRFSSKTDPPPPATYGHHDRHGAALSLHAGFMDRYQRYKPHVSRCLQNISIYARYTAWPITSDFRRKLTPPVTDRLWPPPPPRSGTIAPSRNHGLISMIKASRKPVCEKYFE